jgi:hypothetical protein
MATTQSSESNASTPREGLPADHIGILVASLAMAVSGWWGLYQLMMQTIPRVGQRWVFFMLLHIAVTGTVIPVVRFLNVRFTPVSKPIPGGGIILRQASWVGLFAVTCAWLQIPRALTWSVVFFLLIIFVVLESFLRLRERQMADGKR